MRLSRQRAMVGDKVLPPFAVSVDDVEVLIAARHLELADYDNPRAIIRAIKALLRTFREGW
jgi:hypothetical protein